MKIFKESNGVNATNVTRFTAKLMALVLISLALFSNPEIISAATKVLSNFGAITISEKDVSKSIYLSEVFSLGGDNFCGYAIDSYSGTYFATSKDLVNWELQSKYFSLINGNNRFLGVNSDGLYFTDNGSTWKKASLPTNITPYSVKFESGKFKLYYTLNNDYKAKGLMVSQDGETWFDIKDDKAQNVNIDNIFALDNKYIALGDTRTGATGLSVSYATKINEEKTNWINIPTLEKKGYGFTGQIFFNGKTVGIHMYDMQSYTTNYNRDTSKDIYCLTSDFINWEEKTWDEYSKTTKLNFYNTFYQNSTETFPVFSIDGKRFDGLEVLPYKNKEDIYIATFSNFSKDGINWSREAVKISLNGKVINMPPVGSTAFSDIAKYEWARESIDYVAGRNYLPYNQLYFEPTKEVTRLEFVTAIVKNLNIKKPKSPVAGYVAFTDVDSFYDGKYVDIAAQLGLINGVGNNLFNPYGKISREDMMTVTYNILQKLGKLEPDSNMSSLNLYKDKGTVSEYAKIPVSSLIKNSIIEGDGTNVNPKKAISKAEVAVIMKNISKYKIR